MGSRQQGPRSQDNEQQGRVLSSWRKAEVGWGLLGARESLPHLPLASRGTA